MNKTKQELVAEEMAKFDSKGLEFFESVDKNVDASRLDMSEVEYIEAVREAFERGETVQDTINEMKWLIEENNPMSLVWGPENDDNFNY